MVRVAAMARCESRRQNKTVGISSEKLPIRLDDLHVPEKSKILNCRF
jgi:hypothetical protein